MDSSVLTKKIGPLPGWAWGGLVAVAAWWFVLRGKSAAGSSSSAAGSTAPGPNSIYGLGYAQGLQAGAAPVAPAPAASSSNSLPQPLWQFGTPPSGPFVWSATQQGKNQVPGWPAGVRPGSNLSGTEALGPYGWQWTPVPAGTDPSGNPWTDTTYAQALSAQGLGGGIGGPGTARKHAVGSRSAWLWHSGHPAIGARVLYPHYVRAVGGAAMHRREVHRVAQQAGIHPARVMMLNPEHTGRIRIG